MIFRRTSLLLGSFLILLTSTAHAQAPDARELTSRWAKAYNGSDAGVLANLYAKDAELIVYYEGRFTGQRAIRNYWAADMGRDGPLTVLTVSHSSGNSDGTLIQGHYEVVDRTDGHSLAEGQFLHLWVIEEGKWVLQHDAWMDSRIADQQRSALQ